MSSLPISFLRPIRISRELFFCPWTFLDRPRPTDRRFFRCLWTNGPSRKQLYSSIFSVGRERRERLWIIVPPRRLGRPTYLPPPPPPYYAAASLISRGLLFRKALPCLSMQCSTCVQGPHREFCQLGSIFQPAQRQTHATYPSSCRAAVLLSRMLGRRSVGRTDDGRTDERSASSD